MNRLLTLLLAASCLTAVGQDDLVAFFPFEGQSRYFMIPEGANALSLTVAGAQGMSSDGPGGGGGFGAVIGASWVIPDDVDSLVIVVGGQNGFNGGGESGYGQSYNGQAGGSAGNGGGASIVSFVSEGVETQLIVAAGGGGAGGIYFNNGWGQICEDEIDCRGGDGGFLNGEDGYGQECLETSGDGGNGGSQLFGGAGGSGISCPADGGEAGQIGEYLLGGDGANGFINVAGGGGGGGYFGGGGGAASCWGWGASGGGGGGGSSFLLETFYQADSLTALNEGHGFIEVVFHFDYSNAGCTDELACNFDPSATALDGSCDYCFCGLGTNWDPISQTCIVDESACGWQPDGNGDNLIGVNDLLDLLGVYGDTDYDQDGIWDSADDCVGEYDECGVCNGSGPSIPIIESIEILYDSVYAEPIDEWLVFEVGADTTFSYTCFEWQCGDPLEYQGYDYETVQIGEQCWFAENLRTLTYANDDSLEFNLTGVEWSQTANGAVATYGEGPGYCNSVAPNMNACDESVSLQFYGRLYNWLAVDDARGLCPTSWHVGSEQDFEDLMTAMGGEGPASWALRETFGWEYDANGFIENGWGALPGGFRSHDSSSNAAAGYFAAAGSSGGWWTPDGNGENAHWYRLSSYYTGEMPRYFWNVRVGLSVRCIKDAE